MINVYSGEGHEKVIKTAVNAVLNRFGIKEADVDIELELFSEDEIRELNRDERNIDAVTDVLSFPSVEVKLPLNKDDYPDDIDPETDALVLGEIYICLQRAKEQAAEYEHSLSRELGFLAAHGTLHLLGYDHVTDEGAAEMEAIQAETLESVGITRDKTDEEITASFPKDEETTQYTGYVAILGKPNAGKSTLINALVGEKVAIVSWKPQTTRNKILGICNEDNYQMIFVDTPGLHAPKNALGKFMMHAVTAALEDVDIVVYVVDGEKGIDEIDIKNIERYKQEAQKKVVVVLNKIDHITQAKVGEILTEISKIEGLSAVVPVSALRNKNLTPLKDEVKKLLSEGEKLFPDDMYTDRNMRFMASEIIREKMLRLLDKEIPYGVGVLIEKFETRQNGIVDIDASIIIQKAAHKPIVLGKGGEMIKRIATYARQDLEDMIGSKVFLTLWVRVKEDWRDDTAVLNELGYTKTDLE